MSDEVAKQFDAQVPGQPEGQSVTLSITLHPNGQIQFQLPMNNKILCYGLLELARFQMDKMVLMHEMKSMTSPRGVAEGLLKRMNGG